MLSNHPSVLGSGGGTAYDIIGGTGLFADGTAAAPSISFASAPTNGIYYAGGNEVGISNNGILRWKSTYASATNHRFQANGGGYLDATSNGAIGLVAAGTNQNITLTPSGTGRVQCGATTDGPTATPLIISAGGTYMNAGTFSASIKIRSYDGGGGIAGIGADSTGMVIGSNYAAPLCFYVDSNEAVRILGNKRVAIGNTTADSGALLQVGINSINAAGGMVFGTDTYLYRIQAQTLAIQGSGQPGLFFYRASTLSCFIDATATQVRFGSQEAAQSTLIYSGNATALTLASNQIATFAQNVLTATTSVFGWTGQSSIYNSSNGVIRLANNAGTDFTRLQFGGTTASFPALARSGTNLLVVDATGGSYTPILASNFWATGPAVTVSAGNVSYGATTATTVGAAGGASLLPATPLGYIIVNVAGTSAKIPYYNA